MTTSQTMIPFGVLFMITRSSAVRFMVAALDKTVLMLGMLSSVPSSINTVVNFSLTIGHTVTMSVPLGLFQYVTGSLILSLCKDNSDGMKRLDRIVPRAICV